jgi:hypothetical protein
LVTRNNPDKTVIITIAWSLRSRCTRSGTGYASLRGGWQNPVLITKASFDGDQLELDRQPRFAWQSPPPTGNRSTWAV